MYINLKYLESKNISLNEFVLLQLIKQNKVEDLSKNIEPLFTSEIEQKFSEMSLIEYVKAKNKSQTKFELIRTTKKANEILDNTEIADMSEEIVVLYDWVKNIYLSKGKQVGNQKRSKMMLAQFSKESQITKNCLAFLLRTFIEDEEQQEYSHNLQYLFFKGESLFSVKFDLNSSRLYQYYLKNEDFFLQKFKELSNGVR
jgi:hypothetical protein